MSAALRLPAVAVAAAVALVAWVPAPAQPSPSGAAANVAAGEAMSERDCVACHRQKYGSPGAIYLRADRRVNTFAQLQAQVARCNAELAKQYFPEEEEQLVDYLNHAFYRLQR